MTTVSAILFDDLAALVAYPERHPATQVRDCAAALGDLSPDAATHLARFAETLTGTPLEGLQDAYTSAFDFDPACSLELGWHLFGEAFERGAFLAQLREDLAQHGVPETAGLPDHLAHVLPLLAREKPAHAVALAERVAPAIAAVRSALSDRRSVYVELLAAVDSAVAAVRAKRTQEPRAS